MQSSEAQSQEIHLQNTHTKDSGDTVEEVVERLKEKDDQKVFCEIVSSSRLRSYTHKVLQLWLLKRELTKNSSNRCVKLSEEKPTSLTIYKELRATQVKLRAGEVVFPREENTIWLFSAK